jgi:ATP-dependent Clp protease ATP-binding subunit ClpX
MDTSQILFICGGTFTGVEEIVKRRLGRSIIGFASETNDTRRIDDRAWLQSQITPDDLIHFGMIPELIGRLPILAPLMPLTEETMVQILTEPKNALVRQYQHMFTMENSELEFTPSALSVIAHRAMERHTGARALRGVMEEMMLHLLYELPEEHNAGGKYVLDANAIESKLALADMKVAKKESA